MNFGKSLIFKPSSLSVGGGGGRTIFNAIRKGKWREIHFETTTIGLSICWYFTRSTPFPLIFQLPSPKLNSSTSLYLIYVQHKSCPEATVDRPVSGNKMTNGTKLNDRKNSIPDTMCPSKMEI